MTSDQLSDPLRVVTPDTPVTVNLLGTRHAFKLAGTGPAPITSWAQSLSDLTGYQADHLIRVITTGLARNYGTVLATAAGDLCPIRFLVTVSNVVPMGGNGHSL